MENKAYLPKMKKNPIKSLTRTVSAYKARLHNGAFLYLVDFFDIHSEAYGWCKERVSDLTLATKKERRCFAKIGRTKKIYKYKPLEDYQ
jgi:hypothetical protein